ncbi:MAG: hypothetical protein WC677_03905 [Clostridia bacterium]|jgi:hypothetical protein
MACFMVPMAEAIVVTVIKKTAEKKEKDLNIKESSEEEFSLKSQTEIKWSTKLGWLNKLLWGGVLLLAVEHLWHGEVVPWPPFLTAMNNPADIAPMLHEIATVGTSMAVFVTLVWGTMVLIADRKVKAVPGKAQTEN